MSSSHSPVLDAEQRAWHYWFADGLPTLVAGVGSVLVAFVLLYGRHRPATPLSIGVLLAALTGYGAVLLRHREIVEWLKSKITYRRTGYIRPPYFTEDATLPVDFMALSMEGADARPEEVRRVHADRKRRMAYMIVMVAGHLRNYAH